MERVRSSQSRHVHVDLRDAQVDGGRFSLNRPGPQMARDDLLEVRPALGHVWLDRNDKRRQADTLLTRR
jgi:hypothetical protein